MVTVGAFLVILALGVSIFWREADVAYLQDEITFEVDGDWEIVCLSSQAELPDFEFGQIIGKAVSCWGRDEVPWNSIFITYSDFNGNCRRQIAKGQFLENQNSETRCFSRAEAMQMRLVKKNGVFYFEQ